jgi:hypothetical protein
MLPPTQRGERRSSTSKLIPITRSKIPAQLPSGFIPIRFLKLHPLSNIPLPEGRGGTAWEPIKPGGKNVPRPPLKYLVSHYLSPRSPLSLS